MQGILRRVPAPLGARPVGCGHPLLLPPLQLFRSGGARLQLTGLESRPGAPRRRRRRRPALRPGHGRRRQRAQQGAQPAAALPLRLLGVSAGEAGPGHSRSAWPGAGGAGGAARGAVAGGCGGRARRGLRAGGGRARPALGRLGGEASRGAGPDRNAGLGPFEGAGPAARPGAAAVAGPSGGPQWVLSGRRALPAAAWGGAGVCAVSRRAQARVAAVSGSEALGDPGGRCLSCPRTRCGGAAAQPPPAPGTRRPSLPRGSAGVGLLASLGLQVSWSGCSSFGAALLGLPLAS